MRVTQRRGTLWVAWALVLTWWVTPVLLGNPDVCCPWPDFLDYGDGSDGIVVISTNTQLSQDKNYEDLTIQPGVTLDSCGHAVRVCGTLEDFGTITDSCSGGQGGLGGAHGKGHDPWEDDTPAYCELQPLCTDGDDGQLGDPPSPSAPQAGHGGGGGGAGGGGGGDAGTVEIHYAELLNDGEIRANGGAGGPGGAPGGGCSLEYRAAGHGGGCSGGAPNGGNGGRGAHQAGDSSGPGTGGEECNGANGADVAPLLIEHQPYCKIGGQCYWDGETNPENECEERDSDQGSMTEWSPKPDGTACGDPSDTDCDDPDTCDGAGTCLDNHESDGTSCDDGLFCNGLDACSSGTCSSHAGDPCAGGEECNDYCNEGPDDCYNPPGMACGDPSDDDCTDPDTCDDAGTCLDNHEPAGTSCDDGLFCNGPDACSGGGTCSRHAGYPCAGNEWCDDSGDVCVAHGDGDFELDSDIDLADFVGFQVCFDLEIVSGSACEPANMTGADGKIDLDDYSAFNAVITGP